MRVQAINYIPKSHAGHSFWKVDAGGYGYGSASGVGDGCGVRGSGTGYGYGVGGIGTKGKVVRVQGTAPEVQVTRMALAS